MSDDKTKPQVRERFWVEKFDHSVDPPRLMETVFVENGVVQSVEQEPAEAAPKEPEQE